MPPAVHKPRALVTPEVLAWARKEAGFNHEIAAHKLAVKPDRLARWESGEDRPTIPQLLKLSEVYKRNPAIFYLPEPPRESLAVHDFRRLPEAGSGDLSSGLRYEIRLAGVRRAVLLSVGAPKPSRHICRRFASITPTQRLRRRRSGSIWASLWRNRRRGAGPTPASATGARRSNVSACWCFRLRVWT